MGLRASCLSLNAVSTFSLEIDSAGWSLYEQPEAKLLVHDWPKKT